MSPRRWAGLAGLTVALALYTAGADRLWNGTLWPDLLFLTLVLFPATLGIVWLLLPLRDHKAMLPAGLVIVALAVALHFAELDVLNNLAKLFALICLGFWFLSWFENVMWAALIAVIIPWVDAISVWRGPTHSITAHHFHVYLDVAIAFLVPAGRAAYLGPPDVLFYALFLAAAARWGLRVWWTWIATTFMYGITIVIANAVDVGGLPALPFLSFGFLLANADLLWARLRPRSSASSSSPESSSPPTPRT